MSQQPKTRRDGPLRAAVYVRISKDRAGTGLGVERQLQDCRKLADLRGWVIDESWVLNENDTSATLGPRPKFERLMQGMESGAFDVVLAYKVDRLVRQLRDMVELYDLARKHGVVLATSDGNLDLSTDGGRAQALLLGALSEIEIGNLKDRLKRKAKQSRDAGRPANGGSRPFGWELNRSTPRAEEADQIRYLADQVIVGHSLTSLCRYLNDNGILTPGRRPKDSHGHYLDGAAVGRGPWTTPRLRTMLASPRHAGLVTHQGTVQTDSDGQPIRLRSKDGAVVPPIIEPERHALLVAALSARSFTSDNWSTRRSHLLSGLARCGVCKAPLQAARTGHTGKPWVWTYRCRGHVSRKRDLLDEYVLGEVVRSASEHPVRIAEWESEEQEEIQQQIAAKERQLAKIEDEFVASTDHDVARVARLCSRIDTEIELLQSARLQMLTTMTGAEFAQFDLSKLLASSASLLPPDADGQHDKGDLIEWQRGAIRMHTRTIEVHPCRRGRFDPSAISIDWADSDRLVWRAVVEG